MSLAWETTTEDVDTVLRRHGVTRTQEELVALLATIETDCVEEAALAAGAEMDEQVDAAHREIELQLKENKVI